MLGTNSLALKRLANTRISHIPKLLPAPKRWGHIIEPPNLFKSVIFISSANCLSQQRLLSVTIIGITIDNQQECLNECRAGRVAVVTDLRCCGIILLALPPKFLNSAKSKRLHYFLSIIVVHSGYFKPIERGPAGWLSVHGLFS